MSGILADPSARLTNEQLSLAFLEIGVSVSPANIASWVLSGVPTDPRTRLTRKELAAYLTAIGYPITRSTLDCLASRGGGPPYCLWRSIAICEWGDALKWAQDRITAKRATAREGRELERAAREPAAPHQTAVE